MRIVLASTSKYRKALLERVLNPLKLTVECVAPECDESYPWEEVGAVVRALSERKARATFARLGEPEGTLIIGSDQIAVSPSGERLHKPLTHERAFEQLKDLAGKTHQLVTGVAVLWREGEQVHCLHAIDRHSMTLRPLSDAAIERYLRADTPYDCAGSYKLESLGIALMAHVQADPETADESAIVGLPLMKTLALMQAAGLDLLEG